MDKLNVSRRGLLKWSALAATAVTGFTACSKNDNETQYTQAVRSDKPDPVLSGGEWVGAFCWYGCGSGCVNQAYVKDGVILRQKTDDSHPDSVEYPQQRGCLKGRSTGRMIFAADRLKYPMKRKHWQPGGGANSNGHLRGKDEWVRISWDEALKYIADEVTRIKNTYGNLAILNMGAELDLPALNAYGGATSQWGQQSCGAWPLPNNLMKGGFLYADMEHSAQDRLTMLQHTKLLVLWGQNPAWSKPGIPSHMYRTLKDKGAKIIIVDPWYNPSCQALADEWIPVRPGTDTALLLAVAHELIINSLHDQNFLNKYTIGFDKDHMPVGADPKDNFKDYVLGTYDGIAKTAEWASEICGTPVASIKSLAQQMGTIKPMAFKSSYAPARTANGGTMAQAFFTVGWMTGNVGKPGAEVTCEAQNGQFTFCGPALIEEGWDGTDWAPNAVCGSPRQNMQNIRDDFMKGGSRYNSNKYYGIPYAEIWNAVLNGRHRDMEGRTRENVNIKMFAGWGLNSGARLNQVIDTNKGVQAYRKVEFAVMADFFLTPDCAHSDIVLPITTPWERDGHLIGTGNRDFMAIKTGYVVPPYFESKDDDYVDIELMKLWNIPQTVIDDIDIPEKQRNFNMIAGAEVRKPDGNTENLVEITADDLLKHGLQGTPQSGRIPYEEFAKKGWYQIERHYDDAFCHVPFKDFVEDSTPLNTASGKLEIYCESLVKAYDLFGLTTIAPIAKYTPADNGYEATFSSWDAKVKGEYPFQVISVHPIQRVHTNYDNMAFLREVACDSTWINTLDAERMGIKQGEWIIVSSQGGKIARRATVTPTVMPGVVITMEGARTRYNEKGDVDLSGNQNILVSSDNHLYGEGQQAWNTVRCDIEKYDPELYGPIPRPDFLWAPVVPKFSDVAE